MARQHLRKDQDDGTDSTPTSALDLLKSLGAAAGVLTGLAFINGWLYWATYYTAFGLNSLVLDLSFSVVSVSPVQVLVRDWQSDPDPVRWFLFLGVLAGTILTVWFAHWYRQRHPGATVLAAILALGMSIGAWTLGRYDARLDSSCQSRLPIIVFDMVNAPDQGGPPPPCLEGSPETCLLVLHVNNAYRYFQAPDPNFCENAWTSSGAGRTTYEMPDSQIRMANIQNRIGW
ncbi:MAG TPA: hypothetical protein VKB88_44655 [Bryobacteraceae bacterium]|nr:hypothetical protein [Bryobacteraceae bacterium]